MSRPDIGTGLWKFYFIYFTVTSSSDLRLYLAVICCLPFTMCESLLYRPFDSSLSPCISTPPPSIPFDPFLHFHPLLLLLSSLLLPSIHPPLLLPAPGSPSPALSPPCPPPSLSASPVPLTPHAAPIPRKPLQTASAIKAHSQSARQPVSQPASLLLRLKITVVPVARLLSSSDTHQRSS